MNFKSPITISAITLAMIATAYSADLKDTLINKTLNKEIIGLSEAYKDLFKTENLTENLENLDSKVLKNSLVNEVIEFINKDKKRPICTPNLR